MTTREFFEMAASRLTPRGVLVVNVGRAPGDRSLINGLATTLATVFPAIQTVDIPGTLNAMGDATMQPTASEDFFANLTGSRQTHPFIRCYLRPCITPTRIFNPATRPPWSSPTTALPSNG